tara:strand:- start:1163 stop:1765 length:603 start_codon:yes stop_codon:yes gene_type:complete
LKNNNNNNEKKKKKKKPRNSVLFLPLHSLVFLDLGKALKTNLKSVPLVGILFGNDDRDLVLKTHLSSFVVKRGRSSSSSLLFSLCFFLNKRAFFDAFDAKRRRANKREIREIRERTFTTTRRRRRRKKEIRKWETDNRSLARVVVNNKAKKATKNKRKSGSPRRLRNESGRRRKSEGPFLERLVGNYPRSRRRRNVNSER